MLSLQLGRIPKGSLNDKSIIHACDKEDSLAIRCNVNKRAPSNNIINALEYIYGQEGHSERAKGLGNLTRTELVAKANVVIDEFWQVQRHNGATCDFGGVGILVEKSKINITADDDSWGNDDEYFGARYDEYQGPRFWVVVLVIAVLAFGATAVGFIVGMRMSEAFNKKVREARAFQPLAKSNNRLSRAVRQSLSIPAFNDYEEIRTAPIN